MCFACIKYGKSPQKASEKAKATFMKALCKYECFTLSLVELIFAVFSPPIVMWADDSLLMLINTCAYYQRLMGMCHWIGSHFYAELTIKWGHVFKSY